MMVTLPFESYLPRSSFLPRTYEITLSGSVTFVIDKIGFIITLQISTYSAVQYKQILCKVQYVRLYQLF
jgi:hypothetical protein